MPSLSGYASPQIPSLTWSNSLLLLIGSTITFALLKALYNVYFHRLSHFPGPKVAAATSWWQVYVDLVEEGEWALKLVELHRVYGEIVRIGPNELHFSRPSVYHEIYNQKNRWTKDAKTYRHFASRGSSVIMSLLDYEPAKKRRDYTTPLFSRKNVLSLQPLVQTCIGTMCENIDMHIDAGNPIEISKAIKCAVVDIISAVCFGRGVDACRARGFDAPLVHALHATLEFVPVLVHFPFIRDVASANPRAVAKALPDSRGLIQFRDILVAQVEEIKQDPRVLAEYPHRTIYHEFMKDPSSRLPDKVLVDEGMELVTAGTDTTSDSMTLGVVHVLDNPQIYARLKQEITEAWPLLDQSPTQEVLEKLPYFNAVIKESLRMYFGLVRPMMRVVPASGVQLSGTFIPGGTVVGISNVLVHANEDIFPEPGVFRPERWLGPDAEGLEEWLVPFSKGPRSCPGMNLAWTESYLVLANLFRRYDFKLHSGSAAEWKWKDCILPQYIGPDILVLAERRKD